MSVQTHITHRGQRRRGHVARVCSRTHSAVRGQSCALPGHRLGGELAMFAHQCLAFFLYYLVQGVLVDLSAVRQFGFLALSLSALGDHSVGLACNRDLF